MKSPKAKLVLALVAMFVFGAISGAGLTLFCHSPFFPPPRPEEMQKQMMSFLTRRLNLTPDQQEKIQPIAADFANQAETASAETLKKKEVLHLEEQIIAVERTVQEKRFQAERCQGRSVPWLGRPYGWCP